MAHVLCVESIVTEFVHHDLVCREVVSLSGKVSGMAAAAVPFSQNRICSQQQSALAELIAMRSVLESDTALE